MSEEKRFVLFAIFLVVLWIVILYARQREKKIWNKGKCPVCGKDWIFFDQDSQGGRIYKCDECDNHCTITYEVDK